QSAPTCRCMVKFHWFTVVGFASKGWLDTRPKLANGVAVLTTVGDGSPPGYPAHGSDICTLFNVPAFPNGAFCPNPVNEITIWRSMNCPAPARTDMRPSPFGSQARAIRGRNSPNLLHSILVPHLYCESPG